MQDIAASFPSLRRIDDLAPPAPAAKAPLAGGEDSVRRVWQQPLGDVHVKLGNIVGAAPLLLKFDASDAEFVFALTARLPLHFDQTASLYEADAIKLADALNGLVRLYAIESGNERLHIIVEARRGKVELPAWWQGAPILVATYAFDTGFAQVGLFSDIAHAYEDMELIGQPHRLLVLLGPATPPHLVTHDEAEAEDGAWIDPDEERLKALKRWNQQLSQQINRLLADALSGGEVEAEAMVEALSRLRAYSGRLSSQIIMMERRVHQPKKQAAEEPQRPSIMAPRAADAAPTRIGLMMQKLKAALADGLKPAGENPTKLSPAQAMMQRTNAALEKIEKMEDRSAPDNSAKKKRAPAAPVAPAAKLGNTLGLIALLCMFATPVRASTCATGLHSGLEPYPDIMQGCGYMAKTPSATDCRPMVAKSARRRFGRGAAVAFGAPGRVTVDGAAYSYTCHAKSVALTPVR